MGVRSILRCNSFPAAPRVSAVADIVEVLKPKYSLEYSVVMGIERLFQRGSRQRVMLRITPAR